jgi:hypothetical protein
MVLVAMWMLGQPVVARAQADIPPEVRQALEKNARAFAPIALMLEKRRDVLQPQTELGKNILGTYADFRRPCTYEYLSQDGLCYARFNNWVIGGTRIPGTDRVKESVKEKWQELSWDGKCVYMGAQNVQPQLLTVMPIGKVATDYAFSQASWYDEDDYLRMTGIAVPCAMTELPEGPRSEVLHLLEGDGRVTGVQTERLDGSTEHLVVDLLSGNKKHRFWLDPSRGYVVRRHEVWNASGALAVVIDNSDFVKLTDPELWLPKHCRAEWHTWRLWPEEFTRATAAVVDVHATRLERARVPPEKFALNYAKPGSYISDGRVPGAEKAENGRVLYRAPADPGDIEEAIRAAQEGAGYVPRRRPLVLGIIGISLALGALAIGIIVIRRRRQGRKTP